VCKLRKDNVVQNAKIKTLKAAYAQLQAKAESIGLPRGDHFRFDSVFTYKIQVNRNFEKKNETGSKLADFISVQFCFLC